MFETAMYFAFALLNGSPAEIQQIPPFRFDDAIAIATQVNVQRAAIKVPGVKLETRYRMVSASEMAVVSFNADHTIIETSAVRHVSHDDKGWVPATSPSSEI